MSRRSFVLIALASLLLAACAALSLREPLQVHVADVEALPGEGLELRMLVKLRVQNPNDTPLDYDGASLQLEVLDRTLATGVSDERGTIPRFGEALVSVPVTISTLDVIRNALGMLMDDKPPGRIGYRLEGKLHGALFGSVRFESRGELTLPARAGT